MLASDINTVAGSANGKPCVRLYQTAGTSVPDNANTVLTFDTEDYDTHGLHSTVTNPSRITINAAAGAGIYRCKATMHLPARGDYSTLGLCITRTGTNVAPFERVGPNATSAARSVACEAMITLNVGDYVEVTAFQDNTANVAVTTASGTSSFSTVFEVEKIRDLP